MVDTRTSEVHGIGQLGGSRVSREDLLERFDKFAQEKWCALFEDAMKNDRGCKAKTKTPSLAARARAAQKVQLGEVSRARQCLVGASVAPGTNDTFRAMQGRRPQEVVREIPEEVRQFEPGVPVVLGRATFVKSLQTARRGSSPGPGGWTYEHLKIMLEGTNIFDMLFEAASSFAQARIPEEVKAPLMSARLTALAKEDGGLRGNCGREHSTAVGREDVGQAIRGEFEEECAPFQYALSTRAGTDCVGHMLRAATRRDWSVRPHIEVSHVDEVGADAKSQIPCPFREDVVRCTIKLFLV